MKPKALLGAIVWALLTPLLTQAAFGAAPTTLDKPMPVQVYLRGDRHDAVAGNLVSYDDQQLTIKAAKQLRTVRWIDLTSVSAYNVRHRLIDKHSAADWLDLGRFAWSIGDKDDAHLSFNQAVTLDSTLKDDVHKTLAAAPGSALNASSTPAANPSDELIHTAAAKDNASAYRVPARDKPLPTIVKFQKSTPQQDAAEIASSLKEADEVQKTLNLRLARFQTRHFIVFTDWDPREFDFLKTNIEQAYDAVSHEFVIDSSENIFIGKLPVYMFDTQDEFQAYADQIDAFDTGRLVAGYYMGGHRGLGHMAMWRPDLKSSGGDRKVAEIQWAMILTHEFTHAFVARYRTNRMIPRWLNEGIAEVVAHTAFPQGRNNIDTYTQARQFASTVDSVQDLFDDDNMPPGEAYPLMETMVRTLADNKPDAFIDMFNAIKDGSDPQEAMQKYFGVDYVGFESAWRKYLHIHH